MSSLSRPYVPAYTQGFGTSPIGQGPYLFANDPTTSTLQSGRGVFSPGSFILNTTNGNLWYLESITSSAGIQTANWVLLSTGTGTLDSLTGDTGTATATAGAIKIAGTANQITTAASGSTVTLSLPSAVTLPGSLTVTTLSTLTGGINTAPTVVAAGASPLVANNRTGQVTFSGVSIAGGATQTFVITNSTVTGSGTVILYSLVGATTGAALNIQSVTNSAGSSSIVVENGTGLTTSTANITFTYIVLN